MDDRFGELPLVMQGPQDNMANLLLGVCDDMGIIRSGIVIRLQVDPVNE